MRRVSCLIPLLIAATACLPLPMGQSSSPAATAFPAQADVPLPPTPTETSLPPSATPTPARLVPEFQHIVVVVFENKEYETVINDPQMPYFNKLARTYTLLTQHYAVTHPSLPNYLALIGGDTFDITFNCDACLIGAPSLPDLIEAAGRTWKTYQENMPSPCFERPYAGTYAIKHNPFLYFKPIRLDAARCQHSVVPLTQLALDLEAGALPNFVFITPDLCNSAHDCPLSVADEWLRTLLQPLLPVLDRDAQPYLVIITWDEGQGTRSCCGLPKPAGGRVATILISPQAQGGFKDDTPYSHYSLLKTIAEAWGLPYLGHAANAETNLIVAPWK